MPDALRKPRLSPSGLSFCSTRGPREEEVRGVSIPPGSGSFCRRVADPAHGSSAARRPTGQFAFKGARCSTVREKMTSKKKQCLQRVLTLGPRMTFETHSTGRWMGPQSPRPWHPWWPSHAGLRPIQREPCLHPTTLVIYQVCMWMRKPGLGRKISPALDLKQASFRGRFGILERAPLPSSGDSRTPEHAPCSSPSPPQLFRRADV